MSSDNTPLRVSRNEAGFWVLAEQLDRRKSEMGMSFVFDQDWTDTAVVTGTTVETTFSESILIPGGLLGPRGSMRVTAFVRTTNNANSKIFQIKFGGISISGSTLQFSGQPGGGVSRNFGNRGAENLNRWYGSSSIYTDTGLGSVVDTTIDTAQDQPLTFTGTLAVGTDSIWLTGYRVEVFPTV